MGSHNLDSLENVTTKSHSSHARPNLIKAKSRHKVNTAIHAVKKISTLFHSHPTSPDR